MAALDAIAGRPIVARAVFTAGGIDYTWGDVVVAARLRGAWAVVERDAASGLAALAELHSRGEGIDAAKLDDAGRAFRYERDLLSGDEMEAWLERWDLSPLEWSDRLARILARLRLADRSDELVATHAPDADEVETAAAVEAVCSGALEQWARELAERAAVALARGVRAGAAEADPPPTRGILALSPSDWEVSMAKVAPLDLVLDRVLADVADDHAIAREVSRRRLDWLAFKCRFLRLPTEAVAREALLCVRDDGWALDRVASAAGAPLESLELVLEDAPVQLQPALVEAREGELVGPVADGDQYLLLVVDRKRQPGAGDRGIAARARRRALDRAAAREAEGRIQWHERI